MKTDLSRRGFLRGLAGVSGPLYLAECMSAAKRGRGAGMFQLVIVIGLFVASLVGLAVAATLGAATDPNVSVALKTVAWKTIFWSSAVPGAFLFVGSFFLKESPVWKKKGEGRTEKGESEWRCLLHLRPI